MKGFGCGFKGLGMKEVNGWLVMIESMRRFELQSAFQRDETDWWRLAFLIWNGEAKCYLYGVRICGG